MRIFLIFELVILLMLIAITILCFFAAVYYTVVILHFVGGVAYSMFGVLMAGLTVMFAVTSKERRSPNE